MSTSVWRALVLPLLLAAALHGAGLYVFTRGFFLSRYELNARSTCARRPPFRFPSPPGADPTAATTAAAPVGSDESGGGGCWMPAPFDRAVLLIVDALRFDFAYYNHSAVPHPIGGRTDAAVGDSVSAVPFYQNKLVSIHNALRAQPARARLFHFEADAPTVTMQRIKGLTTGSLPTFIDVKNNFESSAIDEDSWVQQLAAAGRRVVFMGDDTWVKLFPASNRSDPSAPPSGFSRAYPFPSFNVKDLHTVDNGCIQNLLPTLRGERAPIEPAAGTAGDAEPAAAELTDAELRASVDAAAADAPAAAAASGKTGRGSVRARTDWDVVIAHFLGVDHVGHKFSAPNVPAMQSKLTQIDGVIQSVIDFVDTEWNAPADPETVSVAGATRTDGVGRSGRARTDERVVVMVLGDHGMTGDGNHGGQTSSETDTTLFVYSSHPLFADVPVDDAAALKATAAADGAAASAVAAVPSQHAGIPGREGVEAADSARVPQIDFVPTLSLLLGVPIPYNNLGAVVPELFMSFAAADDVGRLRALCDAYHHNAAQVATYIHHYHTHAQPFPADEYARLTTLYGDAERTYAALSGGGAATGVSTAQQWYALARAYQDFLRATADMCRSKWTMFDLTGMALGKVLLAAAVFVALVTALWCQRNRRTGAGTASRSGSDSTWWPAVACAAVIGVYAQGLFTNSFIVHEHALVLALSAVVCVGPVLFAALQRRVRESVPPPSLRWWVSTAAGVVGLRAMALDWSQRYLPDLNLHELWTSVTATAAAAAASASDGVPLHPVDAPAEPHTHVPGAPAHAHDSDDGGGNHFLARAATWWSAVDADCITLCVIAASLLVLPVVYARIASAARRRALELQSRTASHAVVLISAVTFACFAAVAAYWCLPVSTPHRNWLPRAVYLAAALTLLSLIAIAVAAAAAFRSALPVHTVLFAAASALCPVWLLLLGPKSAFTALCVIALVHALCRAYPYGPDGAAAAKPPREPAVVELTARPQRAEVTLRKPRGAAASSATDDVPTPDKPLPPSTSAADSAEDGSDAYAPVSWPEVVLSWFVSVLLFFATGKSNEFSRLPITTAFVGFDEYSFYASGAMLALNAFVGQCVVLTLLVPALIVCRRRTAHGGAQSRASFVRAVSRAYTQFIALYLLRTLLSAANVTVQRRHLMVWAIFAPKYVYDAASGLAALAVALLWPPLLARFA